MTQLSFDLTKVRWPVGEDYAHCKRAVYRAHWRLTHQRPSPGDAEDMAHRLAEKVAKYNRHKSMTRAIEGWAKGVVVDFLRLATTQVRLGVALREQTPHWDTEERLNEARRRRLDIDQMIERVAAVMTDDPDAVHALDGVYRRGATRDELAAELGVTRRRLEQAHVRGLEAARREVQWMTREI